MSITAVREFFYRESTSSEEKISHWILAKNTQEIAVRRIGGLLEGSDQGVFSPDWAPRKWEAGNHQLFEAQTGQIVINGKPLATGKEAWIQDLTFPLAGFIASDKKELSFFVIHPQTQAKIDLVATKDKIEEITVPAGTLKAQRVTLTLAGWRKYFWKGVGHFDPKEGYMIRFEANSGPGSPNIVKELLSKK